MLALPPHESPAPGWWTELSFDRWVAGVAAEMRAAEEAKERAKRVRRLRRQAERLSEQIVVAEGAIEARQYRRRHLYQLGSHQIGPWGAHGEVEHSTTSDQILGVR